MGRYGQKRRCAHRTAGFAAVWVVWQHFSIGAGKTGDGFWYDVARHGGGGVIVFFALSGFILAHVYKDKFASDVSARDYGNFMAMRFARVYPLHLATLLAWGGVVITLGLHRPADNPFSFVLNLFLMQTWGFVDYMSWNEPSWSISVEAFLYLLLPFLLWGIMRLPTWACALTAAGSLYVLKTTALAVMTIQYGWGFTLFGGGADLYYFFWKFLAGVASYPVAIWLSKRSGHMSSALVLAGIATMVYGCTVPMANWIMSVGACLTIVGLLRDSGLGRMIFGNPVAVFLGQISYSLYLTHLMVRLLIAQRYPETPFLAMTAAAILLATAVHFGFERPSRTWLRSGFGHLRRLVPARANATPVPARQG